MQGNQVKILNRSTAVSFITLFGRALSTVPRLEWEGNRKGNKSEDLPRDSLFNVQREEEHKRQ